MVAGTLIPRFRGCDGGSLPGWASLALLVIVGPRSGRFSASGEVRKISGSNLPMAALGALILWFGGIRFNGGSTLRLSEQLPNILLNTMLSGSGGLIAALIVGSVLRDKADVEFMINGSLASLVSITANPVAIPTGSAILVGGIGAVLMVGFDRLLVQRKIDDAVGAIPVHLGAGIWGTLAVPLFGNLDQLGVAGGVGSQLFIQGVAILACGAWTFGTVYVVFRLIDKWIPLRVTAEDELAGLNISEHGAATEMLDLFTVMHQVSRTGDLSSRAPESPFTEVGQIASRYNRVMDSLEVEVARTEAVVGSSMDGIVTFSREHLSIQSLNPTASKMLDFTMEEVRSRPVTRLACPHLCVHIQS